MEKIRNQILKHLESNSKIDLHELAILLDSDEAVIANEVAAMEKEHIICGYHTLIDWDKAGGITVIVGPPLVIIQFHHIRDRHAAAMIIGRQIIVITIQDPLQ